MSVETIHFAKCTCKALFESENALDNHILEQHTQRCTLLALAEKTPVHSKLQYVDNDADDVDGRPDEIAKHNGPDGYHCPDFSCKYVTKKRSILRRHYAQHMDCDEACVYCPFRASKVSEFFGHFPEHDYIGSGAKNKYMRERHEELRREVGARLSIAPAKPHCSSSPKRGIKRTQATGGFGLETPNTRRVRTAGEGMSSDPVACTQDFFLSTQQPGAFETTPTQTMLHLAVDGTSDVVVAPILDFINYPYQEPH